MSEEERMEEESPPVLTTRAPLARFLTGRETESGREGDDEKEKKIKRGRVNDKQIQRERDRDREEERLRGREIVRER